MYFTRLFLCFHVGWVKFRSWSAHGSCFLVCCSAFEIGRFGLCFCFRNFPCGVPNTKCCFIECWLKATVRAQFSWGNATQFSSRAEWTQGVWRGLSQDAGLGGLYFNFKCRCCMSRAPLFIKAPGALTDPHEETLDRHTGLKGLLHVTLMFVLWSWRLFVLDHKYHCAIVPGSDAWHAHVCFSMRATDARISQSIPFNERQPSFEVLNSLGSYFFALSFWVGSETGSSHHAFFLLAGAFTKLFAINGGDSPSRLLLPLLAINRSPNPIDLVQSCLA